MRTSSRRVAVTAAAVLLVAAGATAPAFASGGSSHREHHGVSLKVGLTGSLTSDPTLFGVRPGGRDWTPSDSRAKVKSSGRTDIKVRGLLLTDGTNPVTQISVSLVCNAEIVDTVGPVAFDSDGDARIRDRFTVPERCLAPAILLHPLANTAVYIAASSV